jgi:hypothetical protein
MAGASNNDAQQIQTALVAARMGGASVRQLADAHELAEKHQLHATTAEIRTHIRNVIPDPTNGAIPIGKTLVLGVGSGILAHFLLRFFKFRKAHHV